MTTSRPRPGPAVASLLAAAALVLSACGTTSTGSSASTDASGDNALYDVSARTVSGADWDGATLSGRPAVLWFWAPWCPTCRAQISGVGALAQTHGDDVAVVGVGAEDDASAIAEFASEVDPAVTNLSDVDGSVWRHFGVTAQSTYLVLDAEGEVRGEGYLDDAELADLVEELVDEQAG